MLQPLLLALYPLFFLYSRGIGETFFFEFIFLVLVLIFLVFFLFLFLSLFFDDYKKRALFSSAILFPFFYLTPILENIKNTFGGVGFFRVRYFLPVYLILLCFIFIKLKRTEKINPFFPRLLTLLLGGLFIFSTVMIGVNSYRINRLISEFKKTRDSFRNENLISEKPVVPGDSSLPNIYFIILDTYSSYDYLLKTFGYDNSEFLNKLQERGFFIAQDSCANYCSTGLSLTATLNLNYHTKSLRSIPSNLLLGLYNYMIEKSTVISFLKEKGYKYLLIPSHYSITQYSSLADFDFDKKGIVDFLLTRAACIWGFIGYFVDNTLFAPIWRHFCDYRIRNLIRAQLDILKTTATIEGPVFIFSHFICPHWPHLFDSKGNEYSRTNVSPEGYIGFLAFISEKIYKVVDHILKESKNPPIIILQADHGLDNPMLNTYYLPGKAKEKLYSSISPVNNFRLILDEYFGTTLGLLKDEIFDPDEFGKFSFF